MTNAADDTRLRIWALLGARSGDNDQVIALAEALQLAFSVKQLRYNHLHALGPRLLGSSLASLTRASRNDILGEEPPHLTISTGHRSVPVVRALSRRSGHQMRSIHLGFPRVSPKHFDLVVTTPQYPMPDLANVLRIPYALTRVAVENDRAGALGDLARFPAPRRLLIVGGPTLYWNLDESLLFQTLDELLADARHSGGSVLVTSSPRTPSHVGNELQSRLRTSIVDTLFTAPGDEPPYLDLLCSADSIHVTGDSVSMVSDAIWTGKPMALVPISKSVSGRLLFGVYDLLKIHARAYPQDLRFFWKALSELGIGERLSIPSVTRDRTEGLIKQAARTIIRAA